MTQKLTDEQREWRKDMSAALAKLTAAITAINGPYARTVAALAAQKEVADIAIDDEDIGPCTACEEPIWSIAGDASVADEDGNCFCAACVAAWEGQR